MIAYNSRIISESRLCHVVSCHCIRWFSVLHQLSFPKPAITLKRSGITDGEQRERDRQWYCVCNTNDLHMKKRQPKVILHFLGPFPISVRVREYKT